MKYKVGDKVKIREDLVIGKKYGELTFWKSMEYIVGKTYTINCVSSGGNYYLGGCYLFVSEEMIEGYAEYVKYDTIYDKELVDYWRSLLKPDDLFKGDKKEMKDFKIVDINVIVPNKVVEVVFSDGLKEKMVCHEDDTFDLRNCLFIAISKHLYKSEYTAEGIEYKANELKYLKKYVKIVDSALKNYKKKEEEKKKLERAGESAKAIELRKKAKFERRKAKRKEKQRNERIGEMVEAYVNAMMIFDEIHSDRCECDCDDCECNHGCDECHKTETDCNEENVNVVTE